MIGFYMKCNTELKSDVILTACSCFSLNSYEICGIGKTEEKKNSPRDILINDVHTLTKLMNILWNDWSLLPQENFDQIEHGVTKD